MKRNPDRTSVPVSYRSSESRFIEPGYGPNILPGLRPDATGALFVGIDASLKHDSTALVCVNTISTATIWSWPIIAFGSRARCANGR